MYDFDTVIDRKNTNSIKFDFAPESGKPEDVLPLWVADMDFQAPLPVREKIHSMAEHGIFGYTGAKEDYSRAVCGWFARHFGWQTEKDWIVRTPGVVFALAAAVRALTEKGDAVLIQPPVYYPFKNVIDANHRVPVENRLVLKQGHYEIDFDDFERKIIENNVRMFILCSPHNPIGRVWTGEELEKIGRICHEHRVIVVSDEIHCDFVLKGNQHHIFLQAAPEMRDLAIICTAPSKTFNIAGLQASNIFIPCPELRERFTREIAAVGYSGLNAVGLLACQTAYEQGEEWLAACKDYLQENLDYFRDYLRRELPQLKLIEPEGTYFAWVDFASLGLSGDALDRFILGQAHLWLDEGRLFGSCADTFQRIVLACPRATLKQALDRLKQAVDALG